jgi:hypothetical protein
MTDSQLNEIRYALAQICAILLMGKFPDRNLYDSDISYSKELLDIADYLKGATDRILQSFENFSGQSSQK